MTEDKKPSADPVHEPSPDETPVEDGAPASQPQDVIRRASEGAVLLISVLIVASCGIAYELVIAATGAYIAGDGVTQFSLTIGIYLFSMGLGSFLSRQVKNNLLTTFIAVEVVVGLVGGFANTILFLVYGFMTGFEVAFYALIVFVGTLIGLEIPLLIRLLSTYGPLRVNVANVLGLDYIGALLVSVAFPLLLLPTLGLMRTSLLFGLMNVLVAAGNLIFFRRRRLSKALPVGVMLALGALIVGLATTEQVIRLGEAEQYDDDIILTRQTPYQRVVLTRWRDEVRMYLDGNIQFSSRDEYRYHEALVHPALSTIPNRDRILILGGGDGLGLREVLKYPDVKEVVLVDIDKTLVQLSSTNKHLRKLNEEALSSPKVKHVYRDAWAWLREGTHGLFNAVLVDMPDPTSEKVAKLYSQGFYRMIRRHLAGDGAVAVQSTSPYFAPGAFWCIHETLKAAGFEVTPIRIHVPTFGEWGFNLASHRPLPWKESSPRVATRYLTPELWRTMFVWPADMAPLKVEVSTLDNPRVLFYYQRGYQSFYRSRTGGAGARRRR
ncbi:MAG: polyamine aminopropyltransferase [Polyangia bacterium]|jgi:spermidine synthase|nr:polyamine aminopropyltransferase [Polyangia bacterium]